MSNIIYIHTLGCPKNAVDSEHLAKKLEAQGIIVVDNPESLHEGDSILVNTCGFIETAKQESIDEILRMSEYKERGVRLVVFGCLAKRYGRQLKKELPEIDEIFGLEEDNAILNFVKPPDAVPAKKRVIVKHKPSKTPYGYLKIAEGCDKKCTYCAIPQIRGKFRSYNPDDILMEAQGLIKEGKKELILVSQDLLAFGKGKNDYDIVRLLKDLASLKGKFRIRLLYLNPSSVDTALIETVASEPKICKYFDIPLQHSEDRILKLMGRTGSKARNIALISKIRSIIPSAAIRTTMMIGFPSETNDEFKKMKDFVAEMKFDHLGTFKYSIEDGTSASLLEGKVREAVKDKRLDAIMRMQAGISLEKNLSHVGKTLEVLVDEPGVGRTYFQAPDIDGVVFLNADVSVKPGTFVKAKIVSASDYDLEGIAI